MTQPNGNTGVTSASSTTSDKTEAKPNVTAQSIPARTGSGTGSEAKVERTEQSSHYARLGENVDVKDFVHYAGYREDENYVPDPHFQYGTLETSDTAGAVNQNIHEVSPVFAVGRAHALSVATKALDPEDPTDPSMVSLPDQVLTAEQAKKNLFSKVDAIKEEPVLVGGLTPGQKEAATDADGNVAEAPKGEDAVEEKPSERK